MKLEMLDGMGHDLPEALIPAFIELIATHAEKSATGETWKVALILP